MLYAMYAKIAIHRYEISK